ncbi:EAL domain-containing protein [Iodobacter fluviatilis]|uniref:Bacteriophytochrome cph2 n=1 Tax=Iodobacter fluviatilis TaxID=537 RepID=A0A377Q8Y1_9NEIS|nr:EAL domain-containing protein [Iodobacter fluviatilis]TCU88739.1 EAL domain-containing protein (putative c-di-GMP-specific phosphodiesterase class I) [Iodobacter fluviatilis]STQ91190.1 Bacteriophytochrome cph2 [Iodobacter fluviatilis]
MTSELSRLRRLNHMYRVLSRINQAIVRAESPDGLYQETCRIAVESGLFSMVWIGQLDHVHARLRPLAHCGQVPDLIEQTCHNRTSPAWGVLHASRLVVCNSLADQPEKYSGELAAGLHSLACIPLHEAGEVIGLLAWYAERPDQFDEDVVGLITEVANDISFALEHLLQEQQRLVAETRLRYLAYYDPQTGLPNRALLEQRLLQLADSGEPLALLDIKLQRLEPIARVFGDQVVDVLLRTLAQRLEGRITGGVLAQLAPDEFALVLPGLDEHAAIETFAQNVLASIRQALPAGSGEVFVGAGIGVAIYPSIETQILQLVPRARLAAIGAVLNNEVCFYQDGQDRDSAGRLALEGELHRALERGEFELHYQPQLNMKTGLMIGVEALIRWQHPAKGLIGPALFIPVLESCGLMELVGEWVLRQACAQQRDWLNCGLPPLRMAVNLSAQQFRQPGLVELVHEVLCDSGMDPGWLELELTESLILEDAERTIQTMHDLKKLGVRLALDDFGTGYSSLSYLRRFPVDSIKIDQSFVRDIATQASAGALARAILGMGHNLGLDTIAEGVEDASQLGYLRKQGCNEMQGFLFSHAVTAQELALFLLEERRLPPAGSCTAASATILVVDDELNILTAIKRLLRQDGITVLTASNAAEGFAHLATTEVGVILADQRMPGLSGAVFLDQVKGLYPDSIRILLTGYTELAAVIDAVNRGALYKLLTKPWEDDVLRENVREALHHYETVQENRRLLQSLNNRQLGNTNARQN